ncbi:hypothetical protein EV182_004296, partial [Spiromyces aspiralis]
MVSHSVGMMADAERQLLSPTHLIARTDAELASSGGGDAPPRMRSQTAPGLSIPTLAADGNAMDIDTAALPSEAQCRQRQFSNTVLPSAAVSCHSLPNNQSLGRKWAPKRAFDYSDGSALYDRNCQQQQHAASAMDMLPPPGNPRYEPSGHASSDFFPSPSEQALGPASVSQDFPCTK